MLHRFLAIAFIVSFTQSHPARSDVSPSMQVQKKFKKSADEIKPLIPNRGGSIASDHITVDGLPVGFMYREKAHNPLDNGWRFLSGTEDDEYMNDAQNHSVYDVNTIANYDPSIIPYLDAPVGSVFEKLPGRERFERVLDWTPPDD